MTPKLKAALFLLEHGKENALRICYDAINELKYKKDNPKNYISFGFGSIATPSFVRAFWKEVKKELNNL